MLFGTYVVAHCHLTPGGGFQGGAILGTVPLLMYLTVGFREFARLARELCLKPRKQLGPAATRSSASQRCLPAVSFS